MNHSDRLYSILLSKRYEMRCLTNIAFLFSGPSGRRKARQKDFLLRKAKVRGSESRDLMRIGRSFGEKKQAFAPKEVSIFRKCLLLLHRMFASFWENAPCSTRNAPFFGWKNLRLAPKSLLLHSISSCPEEEGVSKCKASCSF